METYVCAKSLHLHLTLCDPMDCGPPGSSVHGILQNTGMDCHFLLQGIFLTQGSNQGLLHWQADSLPSEPPGKPPKIMLPLNMFDSNIEYLHKISQRLPKISCLHPFLSNHHGLSVLSSSTETTFNPVYVKLCNCYFLSKCYYLY